MTRFIHIVSFLACGLIPVACGTLPLSMTDLTECKADEDCAINADCRSYACATNGKCVFSFEPGKVSTCGPFCATADDCGGLPCGSNGHCGCKVDSDCGSTDCIDSACVNGTCTQHIVHPDDCRPSGKPPSPQCTTADDCKAMGDASACHVWTCIGSPGVCTQMPESSGSACPTKNPVGTPCMGQCTFDGMNADPTCKAIGPSCVG